MDLVWTLESSRPGPPSLPAGVRVYAVGDIHGRDDLLRGVFARIDADLEAHPVTHAIEVYLGDYVDRGGGSREVIEALIGRSRDRDTVFLKGNHETYVTGFLSDPTVLRTWRQFGGLETLMSYGVRPSLAPAEADPIQLSRALSRALPDRHHAFFATLMPFFSLGDYFFVHAGVRPGVPLERQAETDLLWIRQDFLLSEDWHGKMIVHGHTPVREPEFLANRINIDTGAYATGRLTCLIVEHDRMMLL
ncbi:metallophosphoesterase family protein [Rhodoplanes sp. TEM]|uniref:Metallophosphoesterase family protein n=1 Tax=Rhodoplanes tepidamans TaxID=200616 RepID=A0ABT5JBG7_RHOTP|nr:MULTISPECIES: metallophosphoesterase family protein [Rhodoplanes]MDC7786726.1 metallophosphoesterase family protein [Rhodoplanes tepidamans]MDC7983732.1 metallophosphoesterase family protein [Rhodoplanes sp. TEM]MDQ0358163.1 serine/threonine protein phosphatase 1 [Rhodoplanes tepidamans]